MAVVIVPCVDCKGTGSIPHPKPGVQPCSSCDGFKVISRSSMRAYANATTAQRGIDTRKAMSCYSCKDGTRTNPETQRCWHCEGAAIDIADLSPGDVIPQEFGSLTRSPMQGGLERYAREVTVEIRRHGDAVLSTGAALLGLGTVYSVVDYGRAYQANDDGALAADVRKSVGGYNQLCKFADKETRTMATTIVVSVTTNGYAVTSEATRLAGRPMLPPTYTADVLNAPYV